MSRRFGFPLAMLGILMIASALATLAPAQLTEEQIHAGGLGAQKWVFDVETPSGNILMLGVVYLNGEYFVTGGGTTKEVFVFDEAGTLKRKFPQTATSSFGWRDGATDGNSIFFGWESGINVMDVNGNPVNVILAKNGPQTIVQPIKANTTAVSTHRALAYNPEGNGGNGSFWLGNFGSNLVEIDLLGNVLTDHPNTSNWSLYGLVWDPYTKTLLGNSVPNAGEIAQINPVTGVTTGVSFGRHEPGSAQGGLSAVPMRKRGGGWDVVGLDQGTPDMITRYRVHMYTHPMRMGYYEPRLLSAADGGVLDDTPVKTMRAGGTISFKLADVPWSPSEMKNPCWVIVNKGKDAMTNGVTYFGGPNVFPEMCALTSNSTPNGAYTMYKAFGGKTITMPVPMDLADGDYLRIQAVTINPHGLAALTATNQLFFELDKSKVTVECVGSNSFNSVTTDGFFRIRHNSGPSIVSVEFDWLNSTNTSQSTMRFDTNQTGMADTFMGGNSTKAGCQGTYRNGSDVATGLIYDLSNTPSTCDPSANTGWLGTNPGTITSDFKTILFRFTSGQFVQKVFEFDCDTDGGQGINGADMEGMVVTITLSDSTVLKGEVAPDPADPLRSFIRFL